MPNHVENNEPALPEALKRELEAMIAAVEHPRELAVDVMMTLQDHFGHLGDAAVSLAAGMLGMSTMEIEELATFYTFIFREPVGRYVIHVCDSVICWINGEVSIREHLCRKLGIDLGETTADGRFTLLPVCCIGYCDRSPAILVNKKVHGPLTLESLDALIETLQHEAV